MIIVYTVVEDNFNVEVFTSLLGMVDHIEDLMDEDVFIISSRVYPRVQVTVAGLYKILQKESAVRIYKNLKRKKWTYKLQIHRRNRDGSYS